METKQRYGKQTVMIKRPSLRALSSIVIPAKAGIHCPAFAMTDKWIPFVNVHLLRMFTNGMTVVFMAFAFLIASPAHAACTSPAGTAGKIVYNQDYKALQYCNGTSWKAIGIVSNSFPAGSGFFVLTKTTYDGNLGDRAGADAKCLTDLQNNDWMGKDSATLNSTTVKAFLCDNTICNMGAASKTYYFAKSGDAATGGAYFTTDASGNGNIGTDIWSDETHFNGYYLYWTGGRGPSAGDTQWGSAYYSSSIECSQQWDSASSANSGKVGVSANTGRGRWLGDNRTCDKQLHLICFVHP